jgi:Cu/Ag efflux protein CusF
VARKSLKKSLLDGPVLIALTANSTFAKLSQNCHMKRTLLASILAALAACALATAQAADKPPEGKGEAKPKSRPFRGTIKSVDNTAKSITLQGEAAQTFLIISETRIFKDGKPGTFADLKQGEAVRGRARENAEGKWEAMMVGLGAPAPPQRQPPKGEDKKPQ